MDVGSGWIKLGDLEATHNAVKVKHMCNSWVHLNLYLHKSVGLKAPCAPWVVCG